MNPRLGLIVRTDNSGLGYQSRNLARMLNPISILEVGHGEDIPSFAKFEEFLKGIDVMLTCETPYTYEAWNWAKLMGVKTFCQPNWELFDGLVQPNMPHPDRYLMPSYWHLEEMQQLFPGTVYLPPPIIEKDFAQVRKTNFARKGKKRFVHVIGTPAIYDRSGWSTLMDALHYTNANFELVVYSQREITGIADPRVKYHIFNIEDQTELYKDFDAMILPRRYGGLCLPMQEALLAGLPVIMPNISPNNKVLPKSWLLDAKVTDRFEGRSTIDVYSVDPRELAAIISVWANTDEEDLVAEKHRAHRIGYSNYSDKALLSEYKEILWHTQE